MINDSDSARQAVMKVIEAETSAFWYKDYASWADCWLHAPSIRMMGWWARGGIRVTEGWDSLSATMKRLMQENPTPNPVSANVRRENVNIQVSEQMAWVTFEQYGADTNEPDMDMPGLSHETRILEWHDGQWKIVYACWLLEGEA
ncbi:MAG: nuclear transport factor 2 family protein [bacterium]|nr:nuclear transport factor 2 family protein [bacterium]